MFERFIARQAKVMDAVLDRPMKEIVGELALSAEVRSALLEQPGDLHDALDAAKNYEQGRWQSFQEAMERLWLPEACAPECFQIADRSMNAILL